MGSIQNLEWMASAACKLAHTQTRDPHTQRRENEEAWKLTLKTSGKLDVSWFWEEEDDTILFECKRVLEESLWARSLRPKGGGSGWFDGTRVVDVPI